MENTAPEEVIKDSQVTDVGDTKKKGSKFVGITKGRVKLQIVRKLLLLFIVLFSVLAGVQTYKIFAQQGISGFFSKKAKQDSMEFLASLILVIIFYFFYHKLGTFKKFVTKVKSKSMVHYEKKVPVFKKGIKNWLRDFRSATVKQKILKLKVPIILVFIYILIFNFGNYLVPPKLAVVYPSKEGKNIPLD